LSFRQSNARQKNEVIAVIKLSIFPLSFFPTCFLPSPNPLRKMQGLGKVRATIAFAMGGTACLVLYATNTKQVALMVVVEARTLAVVGHAPVARRGSATALASTPPGAEVADLVETATEEIAGATRQGGKAVSIRALRNAAI